MRFLALAVVLVCACSSEDDDSWSRHATQIAVGGRASCALEDDGRVACWGNAAVLGRGAIALGPSNSCVSPFVASDVIGVFCVTPVGMHMDTELRFVELSAGGGDTFCGRTEQGTVHCWPTNYPTCDSQTTDCSKPLELAPGMKFTSITGSMYGFVGITGDGRGVRVRAGVAPLPLPGDHQYRELRTGENTWAGIDTTGMIREGDYAVPDPPQQIATIVGASHIAIGGAFYPRSGCAIDGQGTVSCWGPNLWGGLGDGTFVGRPDPAPILGGSKYKDIATSGPHVCAVTMAGDVDCWGWNSYGQSGVTAQSCPDPGTPGIEWPCTDHPIRIPLPRPATSVRANGVSSCALLDDKTVWCWGSNTSGQLGRGSIGADSPVAEQVR